MRAARRACFRIECSANGWLPRIALLIVLQACLGISTLVLHVPLPLALGHQALAFMLAGATIAWLADVTPRKAAI